MFTLADFCQWLERRGLDPLTVQAYHAHVRDALTVGPEKRLTDHRLAPKSLRAIYAALRAWGRFTRDSGLLERIGDIRLPPAERVRPKVPLTTVQWRTLLRALAHEPAGLTSAELAALELLARRGLRIGDVLRLRRSAVVTALETGVLGLEAKRKRRLEYGSAPIENQLRALIAYPNWIHVYDLIVPRSKPQCRQRSAAMRLSRLLKRIARRIGIDAIHPHQLRRTVAVEFLRRVKGDLGQLAQWMGWGDIRTTYGYVDHSRRVELDRVAAELLCD